MTQQSKSKDQRQVALALGYQPEKDHAPKVTAKGKGFIAEKILEIAQNNGVPIHRDHDLITALSKLEINEEIPPHLYQAIAELLAFLYKLNQTK